MPPGLQIEVISPEHAPVPTSKLKITGRKTLLLRHHCEEGVSVGEATPLEGYGEDSFARAEASLRAFSRVELQDAISTIVGRARGMGIQSGAVTARSPSSENSIYSGQEAPVSLVSSLTRQVDSPSARFCIEMLVLGAAAKACGIAIHRLLVDRPVAASLASSAVLDPLAPDVDAQALSLQKGGVHTFKLKCGRDEEREVAAVQELAREGGSKLSLRLDPNQAWEPAQAQRVLERSSNAPIEWVEDPTSSIEDWAFLREAVPQVSIAVDEFLVGHSPSLDYLRESHAAVAVLKPMALGGFSAAIAWAQHARTLGMQICISHLFDGPMALDAAVELAFCVQSPGIAPGLGEHAALRAHYAVSDYRPYWLKENTFNLPR